MSRHPPGLRHWLRITARLALATATGIALLGLIVRQPSCRRNPRSTARVEPARLQAHVSQLAITEHPRDWRQPAHLDAIADYVADHFTRAGATVISQQFEIVGTPYVNVIARFGPATGETVIVGAHYDACGDTPGADDNASGVAALIELAYLLGRQPAAGAVELVAYTTEEPPFFRSDLMGSAVHARRIAADGRRIRGVIVLEMVGYFDDRIGSQSYPLPLLYLLYPNRGHFIGVIGRWDQGAWIHTVKAGMKGTTALPVYSIRAPERVPGIDFSDHASYWPYHIPAVMISDTAFYRNKAYHSADDTPDRLDYQRMAEVVIALHATLVTL